MGTLIKVISFTLAAILVILLLGSAIAIGARTANYMNRQNFAFGEAFKWSIEEYRDWLNSIFAKDSDVLVYPFTNQSVDIVACTAL